MKKTVKIIGVESDMKKITLLEDSGKTKKDGEPKPNKYKIWITKKDGSQTKAYTQFQKINPRAGDDLEMEVAEEEKEFNGFPYTDRTVMFFYMQDGVPVAPQNAPEAPQQAETPKVAQSTTSEHSAALKAYLQQLEERLKFLEAENKSHHLRICHLEDKDKPDYVPLTEDAKKTEVDISEIPF